MQCTKPKRRAPDCDNGINKTNNQTNDNSIK